MSIADDLVGAYLRSNPLYRSAQSAQPDKPDSEETQPDSVPVQVPDYRPQPSLLSKAASAVGTPLLSGLSVAANVLDVPRAISHNLATWVPGGTPAHNPLNPLMSPTTDRGRVTGRDLLRNSGLVAKHNTWPNFYAGMTLEMATDPMTYTGFGAATKALKLLLQGSALSKREVVALANKAVSKRATNAAKVPKAMGHYNALFRSTLGDVLNELPEAKTVRKDLLDEIQDQLRSQRVSIKNSANEVIDEFDSLADLPQTPVKDNDIAVIRDADGPALFRRDKTQWVLDDARTAAYRSQLQARMAQSREAIESGMRNRLEGMGRDPAEIEQMKNMRLGALMSFRVPKLMKDSWEWTAKRTSTIDEYVKNLPDADGGSPPNGPGVVVTPTPPNTPVGGQAVPTQPTPTTTAAQAATPTVSVPKSSVTGQAPTTPKTSAGGQAVPAQTTTTTTAAQAATPTDILDAQVKDLVKDDITLPKLTVDDFRTQLRSVVPDAEADAVEKLLQARASRLGVAFDDYIGDGIAKIAKADGNLAKGVTQFLDDGRASIRIFEKGDLSSVLHEASHKFYKELIPEQVAKVQEFSKNFKLPDGSYTNRTQEQLEQIRQTEWFAQTAEVYFKTGKAPTDSLKQVFEQFRQWLTDIYNVIKGTPVASRITAKQREFYDSLFAEPATAITKPTADVVEPVQAMVAKQDVVKPIATTPVQLDDNNLQASSVPVDVSPVDEVTTQLAPNVSRWDRVRSEGGFAPPPGESIAFLRKADTSSDIILERGIYEAQDVPELLSAYKVDDQPEVGKIIKASYPREDYIAAVDGFLGSRNQTELGPVEQMASDWGRLEQQQPGLLIRLNEHLTSRGVADGEMRLAKMPLPLRELLADALTKVSGEPIAPESVALKNALKKHLKVDQLNQTIVRNTFDGIIKASGDAGRAADTGGPLYQSKIPDISTPAAESTWREWATQNTEQVKAWLQKLPNDLAIGVADGLDQGFGVLNSLDSYRVLRSLFDYNISDATTETGQEIGQSAIKALDESIVGFRALVAPILEEVHATGLLSETEEIKRILSQAGTNKTAKQVRQQAIDNLNSRHRDIIRFLEGATVALPPEIQPLQPALAMMRSMMPEAYARQVMAGLKLSHFRDKYLSFYWPRQAVSPSGVARYNRNTNPVLDTKAGHQKRRKDAAVDLYDGRALIDEMSIDPKISGAHWRTEFISQRTPSELFKELRNYIAEKYGPRIFEEWGASDDAFAAGLKEYYDNQGEWGKKLSQITAWVSRFHPWYANTQTPIYGRNIINDFAQYMENAIRTESMVKATQDLIVRTAKLEAATPGQRGDVLMLLENIGQINVHQVSESIIRRMGLEGDYSTFKRGILDQFAQEQSLPNAKPRTMKVVVNGVPHQYRVSLENNKLVIKEVADIEDVADDGTLLPAKKEVVSEHELTEENLSSFLATGRQFVAERKIGVPTDVYNDALRFMEPYRAPENMRFLIKALDVITTLFKTHNTATNPAYHGRNIISATLNNFLYDMGDPHRKGVSKYTQPVRNAFSLVKNRPIQKLESEVPDYAGMTNLEANQALRREIFTLGIIGEKLGIAAEQVSDSIGKIESQYPGLQENIFTPAPYGTTWGQAANPLHIQGSYGLSPTQRGLEVKRYEEDLFLPARLGRGWAQFTENIVRIAPYIALRKQGFSPRAAADKVNHVHVDYTRLTSFERSVAKRAIPFYTFSSRMLPAVLEELTTNPGGKTAMIIKTANRGRDTENSTPAHLQDTVNVPLQKNPNGIDSYLTGFGFAFEDPLRFANLLQGDVSGTLRELASRSNPILKGAYEQVTGQSLFQSGPLGYGRPLADMDPPIGRTFTNLYDLAIGTRTQGLAEPFISTSFENLMSNSPLSRYITTLRTVTDPRKLANPLNLLANTFTGIRITDVSPDQKLRAAQDSVLQKLRESGTRELKLEYLPKWKEKRLTEDQQSNTKDLLKTLQAINKERQALREAEKAKEADQ